MLDFPIVLSAQPEGGTETPPAPNLFAPKRGFGKVWREQAGVKAKIGWATTGEESFNGEAQGGAQ